MKFFNKQTLAFAIVGALASGNALSANLIQTTSTTYAKEIVLPANFTVPVIWATGYNFSGDEVRYACLKLDGGTFATAPTADIFNAAAPAVSVKVDGAGPGLDQVALGSVNTNGNVMFFSITSLQGQPLIQSDYTIRLTGGAVNIATYNTNLTATVGLYDNPSNAATCGATGLIAPSYDSKPLISFKPSFTFESDPNQATASVELNPSYTGFKADTSVTPNVTATLATLANAIRLVPTAPAPLRANGTAITLGDIFPATGSLKITGDFGNWLAASGATFGAAAGTVNGAKDAATWAAQAINANTGFTGAFAVNVKAANTVEIPSGIYTAELSVTPNAGYDLGAGDNKPVVLKPQLNESITATDNSVSDTAATAGQIIQDGVRLQAPLVQVPGGWISRMVITNTGNKDRTFSLKVYSEDGTTVATDNLTGYTVKAGKTYVINDLNSVLKGFTADKAARATIVAVVNGPEKEIKGLYQIVNTTNMSLSNYVMVNQESGGH